MGRRYAASFTGVSVTAVQDLLELNASSTGAVVIHSIFIGQSSDAGDTEAEMLQIEISRSTGTSGSGGTTLTARALESGFAAFGGTVEANNTTQATTTTVLVSETFNIQAGWFYRPTPEEKIWLSPSGRVVIELPTAPTDAVTMSGTIVFESFGG